MKMKALAQKKKEMLAQLEQAKAEKQKEVNVQKTEMNKQWKMFCQTLHMPYWKNAQKIWTKLELIG